MKKKNIHMIAALIFTVATLCVATGCSGSSGGTTTEYETKLFDTGSVHQIDISISDEDWADLKENPTDKTKYTADITIDGETVSDVSFATKGNTSLSSVADDEDSDRYSYKVNFGKNVDGQTYYGLEKLNLNNLYADATFMKDYLSYRIFSEAGVDAPLTSYVWLTVNGEDCGLYLAVGDMDGGYLERTKDGEGELYKPGSEMIDNIGNGGPGGKDGERPEMPEGFDPENFDPENFDPENFDPENMKGSFPGGGEKGGLPGFGSSSNGADLKYTDDEIDSYSDIFDNAETNVDEEDQQQVIAALKALSEGEDLEEYLDTDEIIRYFAAHNFVLNYDSYTGSMLHNYYLYENGGKLSMYPWDYNLAFGGFGGGGPGSDSDTGATAFVNKGIDSPLSGASEEDRPMWNFIVSNEEYLQQYHTVMDSLITDYFESGDFEKEIDALHEMLLPYIQKDTTAFYSAEEFETAYSTLKEFASKRAESIRAQLDGTLATVTEEQNESDRIDASEITLSDMGSQGGGKMPGDRNSKGEDGSDAAKQ